MDVVWARKRFLKVFAYCWGLLVLKLLGEWLHAQGRSRSFRPGTNAHDQLCVYLEQECPLATSAPSLLESEKMKRVFCFLGLFSHFPFASPCLGGSEEKGIPSESIRGGR